MKTPKAVLAAEAAVAAKSAELEDAESAVKRIRAELGAAHAALMDARIEADSALTQCRLVVIPWRGSDPPKSRPVVIVRRTPGGMLVTREIGDTQERRFKFNPHRCVYVQAAEYHCYSRETRELRDVPAEVMPKADR